MRLSLVAGIAATAIGVLPAQAADLALPSLSPVPPELSPYYVHAGIGGLFLSEGAKLFAAGTPVQGADIKANSQYTPVLETGYYLNSAWAVSFTGGLPPLVTVKGTGTVAAAGTLGKVRYGPATLTAHYHFTPFGAFRPYAGAGVVGLIVVKSIDGSLTNARLNPALGLVAQFGVDYAISDHWGMFVDVKKAYLRTTAKGYFGLTPVKGNVKLDPLVVSTGVSYRF